MKPTFPSLLVLSLAACAHTSTFHAAEGAPHYAPVPSAEVVKDAPQGAAFVGDVKEYGNAYDTAPACVERLRHDAAEAGASSLVVTSSRDGNFWRGGLCEGKAYR